ncbi:hypothetical protein [Emcibacter sp.]|nr:hypothetical protein [Emcibacter sp.]
MSYKSFSTTHKASNDKTSGPAPVAAQPVSGPVVKPADAPVKAAVTEKS